LEFVLGDEKEVEEVRGKGVFNEEVFCSGFEVVKGRGGVLDTSAEHLTEVGEVEEFIFEVGQLEVKDFKRFISVVVFSETVQIGLINIIYFGFKLIELNHFLFDIVLDFILNNKDHLV
jgi:hypothetical protein